MTLESKYVTGEYWRPGYAYWRTRAGWYMKHIIRQITILPEHRVLEVGCDQGQLTEQLKAYSNYVIGVDSNPASVRRSNKDYLQVMDAQDLRFPHHSFDLVVTAHTIEHIPNRFKAFYHFERVLCPYGFLVLIYPWEPIRGCTLLPEALFIYRSLKICRQLHLHRLTTSKIDRLVAGTTLVQRKWEMFWSPNPSFLSILQRVS